MIHPSTVIDDGALIGVNTRIWHFCHICAGAVIGDNVSIGQNVYVAAGVVIGDGVKIQNNVSIYNGVTLKENVFVGPSVVFTNVSNPRSFVDRSAEYEKTVVERGVTLGANATIICGSVLGEFAFIAAGAVVTRSVEPFALMRGVPARKVGLVSKNGLPI